MFFYYYHVTSFENFRREEIILFINVVIKENVNDAFADPHISSPGNCKVTTFLRYNGSEAQFHISNHI
jgi:hypothetical protein